MIRQEAIFFSHVVHLTDLCSFLAAALFSQFLYFLKAKLLIPAIYTLLLLLLTLSKKKTHLLCILQ